MNSPWYYPFRTWLGLLNFLVLQWFFIRLQETVDEKTEAHERWDIIGPIVPLTGWWNRYWYVGRRPITLKRTLATSPLAITLVRELVTERTNQAFHEACEESHEMDEEDCCDGDAEDHQEAGDRLEAQLREMFRKVGI
jgi:hypothetical protein